MFPRPWAAFGPAPRARPVPGASWFRRPRAACTRVTPPPTVPPPRAPLTQLAQGTGIARDAAQTAAQGLGTVAAEAQANDVWGREIAKMAGEMRALVEEISARLGSVAQGTETLLASAQEIAASSEEQSAST